MSKHRKEKRPPLLFPLDLDNETVTDDGGTNSLRFCSEQDIIIQSAGVEDVFRSFMNRLALLAPLPPLGQDSAAC